VISLRDALISGRWQPSRPRLLDVRDPKPRTIAVLPFADRVVHQALAAAIAPRADRRLIRHTYACRTGRGTHAALTHGAGVEPDAPVLRASRRRAVLPSIDHGVVRDQITKDNPEPWLRGMCDQILEAGRGPDRCVYVPGDDLFSAVDRPVGLPLGNLTSQIWANRYLDPVDHEIKDRRRVRAFLRYMDDMLVFGATQRA
jgi:hypothetical protein